jgi:outer membrane protein
MKKLVTLTLACLIAIPMWAQFNTKGTKLLGGSTNVNVNFLTEKTKVDGTSSTTGKTTIIAIQPMAGYFIMDDLAVGAGLDLSSSTFKADGSSSKNKSSSISLSPFARYYFDKIYVQGGFQVGSQKTEYTFGGTTTSTKESIFGWSLLGGYCIFLNESVTFEPQVGYGSVSYKTKDSDNKDISSGLFLRLGVYVYFAR